MPALPCDFDVLRQVVPPGRFPGFVFADPRTWTIRFQEVPLNGGDVARVAYADLGDARRPALLLLHGWGESKETWRYLAGELAREYHVLAVDLPGFGESDCPSLLRDPAGDVLSTQAEMLAHFIRARGIDLASAVIIAHSMGATVCCALLALTAANPRRLILLAPLHRDLAFIPFCARPFVYLPLLALRAAAAVGMTTFAQRRSLLKLVSAPGHLSREYAQTLSARIRRAGAVDVHRATVLSALTHRAHTQDSAGAPARYAHIAAPTLILWGSEDSLLPVASGRPIVEGIRGARLALLEGANHILQLDMPAELLDAVREFCR